MRPGPVHWFALWILSVAGGTTGALENFYDVIPMKVSLDSIVKTLSGVPATTCLSICRRSNDCRHAALQKGQGDTSNCLQLKNTDPGDVQIELLRELVIRGKSVTNTVNLYPK